MNKFLFICSLILVSNNISAQDDNVKTFIPNGDPIVRIFANVHTGLATYPDDWFDNVGYQGAFGTFNWASGWTLISQEGILVD